MKLYDAAWVTLQSCERLHFLGWVYLLFLTATLLIWIALILCVEVFFLLSGLQVEIRPLL